MENSTYGYYNGTYLYGGRVEICYNQTFYPVCDQGWTDNDAAVTCSNLGYYYYYYRELLRQMESLLMVAKQVVKQQMDRSMVCQMKHRYCRHQCAVELSTTSQSVLAFISTISQVTTASVETIKQEFVAYQVAKMILHRSLSTTLISVK